MESIGGIAVIFDTACDFRGKLRGYDINRHDTIRRLCRKRFDHHPIGITRGAIHQIHGL